MKRDIGLKDVFRNYWGAVKEYKYSMTLNWILLSASAISEIFSPIYIKNFFDVLSTPASLEFIFIKAKPILVIVIGIMLLRFTTRRCSSYINRKIMHGMEYKIYYDAYSRIIKHSHSFFINNSAGAMAHKIEKYRNSFMTLWENISTNILQNFIRSVGFTIVLFIFNKTIGFIMVVWLVLFLGMNYWYSQRARRNRKDTSALKSVVNGIAVDSFSNHITVQLFRGIELEKNNIWDKITKLLSFYKIRTDSDDRFFFIQSLITLVAEIAILILGLYYFKGGIVTVGFFYLSYTYIKKLSDDMWTISHVFRSISEAYVDATDMVELMEKPYEVEDIKSPTLLEKVEGKIKFEKVSYNYPSNEKKVLDGLSITIQPAEKIALIGSSGAGKSTLVKLLFRLFDVTEGSINIDGVDIREITQDNLHKFIGFVPQESVMFHRSIKENIQYGKENASDEEIIEAAKKAHCHEFISALPEGYDSLVGERGVKLSGGERQRIAIARTILKNAPILVLDEATSSLDSETESYIQDSLNELMKGKTVLVIAHRLSTIKKMDRILAMENGKIIEEGSHQSLLDKKSSLYKKLWNLQADGFIKDEPENTEDAQ